MSARGSPILRESQCSRLAATKQLAPQQRQALSGAMTSKTPSLAGKREMYVTGYWAVSQCDGILLRWS